jgi:hypothetical protein
VIYFGLERFLGERNILGLEDFVNGGNFLGGGDFFHQNFFG